MVNRTDEQDKYGSRQIQRKRDRNGDCKIFYCQQGSCEYEAGAYKTGKICFHVQAAAVGAHGDEKQEKEEALRQHA